MNFLLKSRSSLVHGHGRPSAGFTLIEFLVAMAMFMVVGGSVFAMFANNAPYFNRQENLASVNIAIQNVVSQMQLDLANAGTGYYPGSLISSWPIGVTITNQPSGAPACNNAATFTYTAAMFRHPQYSDRQSEYSGSPSHRRYGRHRFDHLQPYNRFSVLHSAQPRSDACPNSGGI